MISGYGGEKLDMHPINIKQNFGYLGPYEKIIEVGDDHNMVFQGGGNGPSNMTPQERIVTKFSQYDELILKYKTKSYLLGNRKISGVDISVVKGNRVGDLQYFYHEILISVAKIIIN